jgi:hypothetical protein
MQHDDEQAPTGRPPEAGRATVSRPAGLDWVQTFVLKAVGDLAMECWDRRLTVGHVAVRLADTGIERRQVEDALDPLGALGYMFADDAPGNPEILLLLTAKGLEAYCQTFVRDFRRVGPEILKLVCQDQRRDLMELARLSGQPELLVEHVLDDAEGNGLLRLRKQGQYVTVEEVRPHLRRWLSGAA